VSLCAVIRAPSITPDNTLPQGLYLVQTNQGKSITKKITINKKSKDKNNQNTIFIKTTVSFFLLLHYCGNGAK
jgi:hypothetical protein